MRLPAALSLIIDPDRTVVVTGINRYRPGSWCVRLHCVLAVTVVCQSGAVRSGNSAAEFSPPNSRGIYCFRQIKMNRNSGSDRRDFLKSVALAGGVVASADGVRAQADTAPVTGPQPAATADIPYPRVFTGPALAMISFPLGGVGAGSIGLGGRGQLRDWEIFNRADKGNSPDYAFPAVWVQAAGQKPIARVLEARIETPYEGQDGLGSRNAPGLSRLEGASFTGEFPLARIDFHDATLPVEISLEAGTPFIPLDGDESGLPVAVLRYRVRNKGTSAAAVSIALSIENPVNSLLPAASRNNASDTRTNIAESSPAMQGLLMKNPALAPDDPGNGSFALAVLSGDQFNHRDTEKTQRKISVNSVSLWFHQICFGGLICAPLQLWAWQMASASASAASAWGISARLSIIFTMRPTCPLPARVRQLPHSPVLNGVHQRR